MSIKSKKSSGKRVEAKFNADASAKNQTIKGQLPAIGFDNKGLDAPFEADVWNQAKAIADQYQVILSFEDGEWYGRGLELPGTMADGATPEACIAEARTAMAGVVASMIEAGERVPAPAREGKRSEQVNLRLSPEEKAILTAKAKAQGFRGLGDFIRSAAMKDAG